MINIGKSFTWEKYTVRRAPHRWPWSCWRIEGVRSYSWHRTSRPRGSSTRTRVAPTGRLSELCGKWRNNCRSIHAYLNLTHNRVSFDKHYQRKEVVCCRLLLPLPVVRTSTATNGSQFALGQAITFSLCPGGIFTVQRCRRLFANHDTGKIT